MRLAVQNNLAARIRWFIQRKAFSIFKPVAKLGFYLRYKKYKNVKKIIYAITPPPRLRNIGDHAQVVAISKWLNKEFSDYAILEFDKDVTTQYIDLIQKIVNKGDIIFLHSGGNLGDRGLWSENARRTIITNFPNNKIISLPQTIFFSKTELGKKELLKTIEIYNDHRDLTVIARDPFSYVLAKKYFSKCKTLSCPDFVLSLKSGETPNKRNGILLCLRNDSEAVITENVKSIIQDQIVRLGECFTEYDTTLDRNIAKMNRQNELDKALNLFSKHKLIITDRFHGIIFSVITNIPCIALRTVDHKLTESVKWFEGLASVVYLEDYKDLPKTISKMLSLKYIEVRDWNTLYFDDLKEKIFQQ